MSRRAQMKKVRDWFFNIKICRVQMLPRRRWWLVRKESRFLSSVVASEDWQPHSRLRMRDIGRTQLRKRKNSPRLAPDYSLLRMPRGCSTVWAYGVKFRGMRFFLNG